MRPPGRLAEETRFYLAWGFLRSRPVKRNGTRSVRLNNSIVMDPQPKPEDIDWATGAVVARIDEALVVRRQLNVFRELISVVRLEYVLPGALDRAVTHEQAPSPKREVIEMV